MELAAMIGISITEFWDITPYELSIAIRGFSMGKEREAEEYQIKTKQLQNLLTIQAYQISNWVWSRPTKSELLKILKDEPEKPKEMSADEMFETVKILNQMFGGEVIYGTTQ